MEKSYDKERENGNILPCMGNKAAYARAWENATQVVPPRWNREERPEMHLLLIEDERAITKAVAFVLERKGHDVDVANDGDEGHDAIANGSYDGIVMDIMMPGRSGTELLAEMREAGDETPVLLLTAKTSLDDKVSGLELGADDYLTKPFEMRELVARIDAMTRKRASIITLGDVSIDRTHGTLKAADGEASVSIGNGEARILELLWRGRNGTISKESVAERADTDVTTACLYVAYLSRKLAGVGSLMTIEADDDGMLTLRAPDAVTQQAIA